MKCQFVIDVDVDVSTMDVESKKLIKWRPVKDGKTGKMRMEPYFPAGTDYEHPNAAYFVERGMAIPKDAACEAACPQLTVEERTRREQEYRADQLGIVDANDRELFFAGVIAGYEQINGQAAHLPGPNYAAYKAAQDAVKSPAKAKKSGPEI